MPTTRSAAGTVVLAAALLAAALPPPSAAGSGNPLHVSNVRHEPDTPPDAGAGDWPGNGFDDAAHGRWDLVLEGYVANDAVGLAEPNHAADALLREATGGGADGRHVLAGPARAGAYWGWFDDKGGGGWRNEAPLVPTPEAPDGVIDDGDDHHDRDVAFPDAARECPPHAPACWRATGPWDEFVWRGPNLAVPQNLTYARPSNTGDDPEIQRFPADAMLGFVHPGTHASWFETVAGNEGDDTPVRTPGYGVVSEGRDHPRHPDLPYRWTGQAWDGPLFVPHDASLLVATRVTVAVNAPDAGAGALRSPQDAVAADRDVYASLHPAVETAYRTTVWDPGDREHNPGQDRDEDDALLHDEGPKQRAKEAYSRDYPRTWRTARQAVDALLAPMAPVAGFAADHTTSPPRKHEPNHPRDVYPGAEHNDGAWYNGSFADEYHSPTQDWSGYAQHEQVFADFENRYNRYAVVLQGSSPHRHGANLAAPGEPGRQNTQGPGLLSHFGWVGTWWDAWSEDTWIGDVTEDGRCSTRDDPYCGGRSSQPHDYSHNPEGVRGDVTPEWRGACDALVRFALEPVGTPTDDAGRPAWGTTTPPAGVYVYPVFGEEALAYEARDGDAAARYVRYGAVEVPVLADADDCLHGQWFPGESVLVPQGTATYPIRTEAHVTLTGSRLDRSGALGNLATASDQEVVDVDVLDAWQGETHDREPAGSRR